MAIPCNLLAVLGCMRSNPCIFATEPGQREMPMCGLIQNTMRRRGPTSGVPPSLTRCECCIHSCLCDVLYKAPVKVGAVARCLNIEATRSRRTRDATICALCCMRCTTWKIEATRSRIWHAMQLFRSVRCVVQCTCQIRSSGLLYVDNFAVSSHGQAQCCASSASPQRL